MSTKDHKELLRICIAMGATIFILLSLLSCSEEYEPTPPDPEFTFFVYDPDNEKFTARIDWGINGLQEFERVTSWGFASSVELKSGEALVLQVDRPGLAVKITRNKDGAGGVFVLDPGEPLTVERF